MRRAFPFLTLSLVLSCAPQSTAPPPGPLPPQPQTVTTAVEPPAPEVVQPIPQPAPAQPPAPKPVQTALDVLVLGDSQISSGAGPSYISFFGNLGQNCRGSALTAASIKALDGARTRAVGVRSTSLHSWTAQEGAAKGTICDIDQKFGVNAAAFGTGAPAGKRYIQIGQEPGFGYCKPAQSAFETVFEDKQNSAKLVVLAFLGNAQERWAKSQSAADKDVQTAVRQLPQGTACLIMTTAPVFQRDANDQRVIAQANLARAVARFGGQCGFVAGLSPETRRAIEGRPEFFRQNESGEVVDSLHPSSAAAKVFFKLNAPKICDALASVL